MNVELVLVLFLALLYGPTVLWLVFRVLRGHHGRQPANAASQSMRSSPLAADEVASLDDPDAFWACGACRSLNRRESNRCYSCRMAKDSASRQAPGRRSADGWVPVMADGIARPSGEAPGPPATPVAPWNTPSVPTIVVPAPEQPAAATAAALAGATACPFLGLQSDPSTRYDFPDPRNSCGAPGTKRSQPIGAEHQESHCLTPAHAQCARYRAVEVVVAGR
jgi:hypothetical protein